MKFVDAFRATIAALFAAPIAAAAIGSALAEQALSAGDAETALRLNPFSAEAARTRAAALIGQDRGDEAMRLAAASIDAAPLNSEAAAIIGYVRSTKGGSAAAEPFMRLAARLSWDNETAQLWMLQRASENGRFDEAVRRADALLRQRLRREELFSFLRSLSLYPEAVSALAARLAERPQWRRDFLLYLAEFSPRTAPGHEAVLVELGKTRSPPTSQEANAFISRLVTEGDYAPARRASLRLHPDGHASHEGDLRFDRLSRPADASPFSWTLADLAGASVRTLPSSGDGTVLRISASGRPVGRLIERLLVLPPGSYALFDEVKDAEGSPPRSLLWATTCMKDGAQLPLTIQQVSNVGGGWNRRTHTLTVPSSCPAERLELRLDHDSWRDLDAWIRRVEIRPL